jgi:type II secretory pathway component PulF
MPEFEYRGKTMAGAQVNGVLKAGSKQDLERILRRNRIIVTNIRKKPAELSFKLEIGRAHV